MTQLNETTNRAEMQCSDVNPGAVQVTVSYNIQTMEVPGSGPALGMFNMFGRTGLPILGAAFLDAENFFCVNK